jgi:hypothetical protein
MNCLEKDFLSNTSLCTEMDCKNETYCYNLCKHHYNQAYQQKLKSKKCKVIDCDNYQYSKQMCRKHAKKSNKCIIENNCDKNVINGVNNNISSNDQDKQKQGNNCSIDGCEKKVKYTTKMLCNYHYKKQRYNESNNDNINNVVCKKRKIDNEYVFNFELKASTKLMFLIQNNNNKNDNKIANINNYNLMHSIKELT